MNSECALADLLDEARAFFQDANPDALQSLDAISAFVRRSTFTVCVAGGFSRGKSHFINLLAGTDILPEAAVPTTGCLTELVYDDHPHVEIVRSGRAEKAPLQKETLEQFSLYAENSAANVILRVHYPAPFLKNGIVVTDTPGVEDICANNAETTFAALQNADAAIVMVSAISPLSLTERAFAEEYMLDRKIPLLAAGVSFFDQLASGHEQKQLRHLAKKCSELYPDMRILLPDSGSCRDIPAGFVCGMNAIRALIASWATLPDLRARKQRAAQARLLELAQAEIAAQKAAKSLLEGDLAEKKEELREAVASLDDGSDAIDQLRLEFLEGAEALKDYNRRQIKAFGEACLQNLSGADASAANIISAARQLYAGLAEHADVALRADMEKLAAKMEKMYGAPKDAEFWPDISFGEMPVTKIDMGSNNRHPLRDELVRRGMSLIAGGTPPLPGGNFVWPMLKPVLSDLLEMVRSNDGADATREKNVSLLCSRMGRSLNADIQAVYGQAFERVRAVKREWLNKQKETLAASVGFDRLGAMRDRINARIKAGEQLCMNIQNLREN